MQDFAYRCGDWVIFNTNRWSESGWITIHAIFVPTKAGVKRRSVSVGWNGERFASGVDAQLAQFGDDAVRSLRMLIAREVPAPVKESA